MSTADEILTNSDRNHLKANHEFFARMTSVFEVVLRLFSRRVLFEREKEQLIRLEGDEDKRKTVASKINFSCRSEKRKLIIVIVCKSILLCKQARPKGVLVP